MSDVEEEEEEEEEQPEEQQEEQPETPEDLPDVLHGAAAKTKVCAAALCPSLLPLTHRGQQPVNSKWLEIKVEECVVSPGDYGPPLWK
jgi:hypothetical protein